MFHNKTPNGRERLSEIFHSGLRQPVPSFIEWVEQAVDHLGQVDPEAVSLQAHDLLMELPLQETVQALWNPTGRRTQGTLRSHRRVLLAARDAIKLTSASQPDGRYDSLQQACWGIGQVLDSRGSDTPAQLQSIQACTDLYSGVPTPQLPAGVNTFVRRTTHLIETSFQDLQTPDLVDEEPYHDARKDFRRVTNVVAVDALLPDNSSVLQPAIDGVALSHSFGGIKAIKLGEK